MKIESVRHQWPERAGFVLDRPEGTGDYVILHFANPVELLCRGERVTAMPGAFIVYPPKAPQWFCSSVPLVHDWARVTGPAAGMMLTFGLQPNTLYYPSNHDEITELFKEMEMEHLSGKPYAERLNEIKLAELFIRISRSVLFEDADAFVGKELYDACVKLRAEMFLHLERQWSIEYMANTVHLSEPRFYVVYKQIFGISPNRDLILARIEKARRLLLMNRYTNTQIAELTGYNSTHHFVRQFKKFTGMPPQAHGYKNKT